VKIGERRFDGSVAPDERFGAKAGTSRLLPAQVATDGYFAMVMISCANPLSSLRKVIDERQ